MANVNIHEVPGGELVTPLDVDILEVETDPSGTPINKYSTWANIKATLKTYFDPLYLGRASAAVAKTIATGDIEIAVNQPFIALTGEGDAADALATIGKTGGGELAEGQEVTLKGKAALAYTITITNGTYLHLQADFPIMNQYDNITLKSVGSGHWIEVGGRVST